MTIPNDQHRAQSPLLGATGAPVPGAAAQPPGPQQPAPAAAVVPVPSLVADADEQTFNGFVELSKQVPIVVDLRSERSPASAALSPVLERVVLSYAGRLLLIRVDVDQSPQIAQAFQLQRIPTVVAIVAGRPVPLFEDQAAEADVRSVLDQLLEVAPQAGVTGTASVADAGAEPEEAPLPPLHQEAYDAIERGDLPAAAEAYRRAIAQQPADSDAAAGLAQVELLQRIGSRSAEEIRRAAGDAPDDADAQLAVADLDVSGGHVEDAFDRILGLFAAGDADVRQRVRERLLSLFLVVGAGDPRVASARARLANLLY